MPKRIQMSRQRPWRADNPDAVKVDRSTKWGNPFTPKTVTNLTAKDAPRPATVAECVDAYRVSMSGMVLQQVRAELAGKDLACWCEPGDPCHADVLLELANGVAS